MEDVLEKMESTLGSLKPKESTSSFVGLYKNWGKLDNQEERRKELLEIQKSNRNAKLDIFRGILDLVNAVDHNDIFQSKKKVYYRPSIYVSGFNKASPSYNNVLMLSEWMIERPSDLAENWYITPCPKGKRVMVVANHGRTKYYGKYGQFLFEMRSPLPGSNPDDPKCKKKDKCSVLDCFYNEKNSTVYVLDLLAWNNQPMTDCDTEFRHFWLQSQFAEIPELGVISKKNKIRFSLLPKVPCTPDELNKFMMTYPHFENNSPAMDGLLFYHKHAHYNSGETPLVVWLFPYMVQEILGNNITVHKNYILQKPVGYVNQAEFIRRFEEKQAKKTRQRRKSSSNNSMDTSDINRTEMETEAIVDKRLTEEAKSTEMEAEGSNEDDSKTGLAKNDTETTGECDSIEVDDDSTAKNHIIS